MDSAFWEIPLPLLASEIELNCREKIVFSIAKGHAEKLNPFVLD